MASPYRHVVDAASIRGRFSEMAGAGRIRYGL